MTATLSMTLAFDKSIHELLGEFIRVFEEESTPQVNKFGVGPGNELASTPQVEVSEMKTETVAACMDELGIPTKFIRRCSKCGEVGRNSRTCQWPNNGGTEENPTYHWKPVEVPVEPIDDALEVVVDIKVPKKEEN